MASEKSSADRKIQRYWFVGFGLLFAFFSLIGLCIAFTTNHWIHYQVDRDNLEKLDISETGYNAEQYNTMLVEDSRFYTRERGLFKTCFKGNETFEFKNAMSGDIEGNCLNEIGYEWNTGSIASPNYEADNFDLRKHLMRSHLAFFVLAIACLALSIIVAAIGCICSVIKAFIFSCVTAFLGALGLLLGMIFFHWYTYIEENSLDYDSYDRKAWHQEPFLDQNTEVTFQYSYFLGWIGFGFAFLAFIMFALAVWGSRKKKILKEDKKPLKQQNVFIVNQPKPAPVQYVPVVVPQARPPRPPPPRPTYVEVPKPVYYPVEPMYSGHSVYQSAVTPAMVGNYNAF